VEEFISLLVHDRMELSQVSAPEEIMESTTIASPLAPVWHQAEGPVHISPENLEQGFEGIVKGRKRSYKSVAASFGRSEYMVERFSNRSTARRRESRTSIPCPSAFRYIMSPCSQWHNQREPGTEYRRMTHRIPDTVHGTPPKDVSLEFGPHCLLLAFLSDQGEGASREDFVAFHQCFVWLLPAQQALLRSGAIGAHYWAS
jgi:hypothetical protein